MMKKLSATVLLASAFALPPKVVTRPWTQEERQKLYPEAAVTTWKSETLDADSLTSGLLRLDRVRDELQWIGASGDTLHQINLRTRTRSKKSFTVSERALAPFVRAVDTSKTIVSRGTWELLKKALYFIPKNGDGQPLWSLPVTEDLVGIEVDSDRSTWMGLSAYPNQLYHMFWIPGSRRDEALMEILQWDQGGAELVTWVRCAEGKSLLVENREGKAWIHQLEENVKLRTLDWKGSSQVSAQPAAKAVARTCSEVYLSGAAGLLRLSR